VIYNIAMAKKTSKSPKRKVPAKASSRKNRSNQPKAQPIETQVEEAVIVAPLINSSPGKLPSVFQIAKATWEVVWENRKLFLAICITYGLLNLILVQGLASGSNISTLKADIHKGFSGHPGSLVTSFGLFAELLSSAGNNSSQTAGAYQIFLFIIISLAVIWTLREILSGHKVKMRDAFYKGMNQIIPFILVLVMFFVQLLPLFVGSSLYAIAVSSGVTVSVIEKTIFIFIFVLFLVWSLYLVTSTIFAVYIVTLPDMTPLKALRSAKALVKKRRLLLIRKIIGLPVILLVVSAVIMLPIILTVTGLAQWVFFILTTISILIVHTYMYILYRELLND
jgi:hypothetical protein